MNSEAYRIRPNRLSEIKEVKNENEKDKQVIRRNNPEHIIQHLHSFQSVSLERTVADTKRKSFRQFLESDQQCLFSQFATIRRHKKIHPSLLVSFDHKVQPIHSKSSTSDILHNEDSSRQGRPMIRKTKIHNKSLYALKQQTIKQNKSQGPEKFRKNQKKELVMKNANPSYLKKMNMKMKFLQTFSYASPSFQCRPWTRRGEREQNEENIQASTKLTRQNEKNFRFETQISINCSGRSKDRH